MEKPKQSTFGLKARPFARLRWKIVMCVAPSLR
jgi:hypothetical protein